MNKAKLLVTFNGEEFDLPFLERAFDVEIDIPHIDLMRVCRQLGYRGGLTFIERQVGIERGCPDLSGEDALRLWREYERGNDTSLDTLINYNRDEPMVPEHGFDCHLIGSVSPFSDSRLPALMTPQSSEYPSVSLVVSRVGSYKVASPNTLVTAVADVTRPNSVESLRRVCVSHLSTPPATSRRRCTRHRPTRACRSYLRSEDLRDEHPIQQGMDAMQAAASEEDDE